MFGYISKTVEHDIKKTYHLSLKILTNYGVKMGEKHVLGLSKVCGLVCHVGVSEIPLYFY